MRLPSRRQNYVVLNFHHGECKEALFAGSGIKHKIIGHSVISLFKRFWNINELCFTYERLIPSLEDLVYRYPIPT
jgi:hypothetical protein